MPADKAARNRLSLNYMSLAWIEMRETASIDMLGPIAWEGNHEMPYSIL